MAVSLRGYTQGAFASTGVHSVAWPSGTAVGDLAVVLCATGLDQKPTTVLPAGWMRAATKSDGTSVHWKILTAIDIAAALPVKARVQMLQVFTGAAGVGATVGGGESKSIMAGGGFLLCGWKTTDVTLTASAKIHATDVSNDSYVTKGITRLYNTWFLAMPTAGTAFIDTNASAFFGVEIKPRTVPSAPTQIDPPAGAISDTNASVWFRWVHNSSSGSAAQSAFRLQLRPVSLGATYYATDTSGTGWQASTPISQPGTGLVWLATMTSFAAGAYEWQVATTEDDINFGPYSAWRPLTIKAKPTVAVATSGSGLARTVTWTPTITNGSQTWYRVRICPSAAVNADVPLYDTGILAGANVSYVVPTDIGWVNGSSYKAWVDFGQTGGQQTVPTASAAFTPSWTPPTAPSAVTVQTVRPLTVTAAGLTVGRRVRLTYTINGHAYQSIRTVAATGEVFPVPLAPYGIAVTYSVEQSQVVSGVELWSNPVTAAGTNYDLTAYLVSPDLADSLAVVIFEDSPRVDSEGVLVSYGIGADRPVVVRTPSQGQSGQTTFIARTQAAKVALATWLALHPSFILRWPPDRDKTGVYADMPSTRMARTTPISEERLAQVNLQHRTLPISWVEQ